MTDPRTHTTRLHAALAGRYRIQRKLGEGGMASVYLAEDLKHERKVALKILKPELAAVIGAERFLAEIKTTANLQHPHILPLFDSGEAEGFLYYVMPYIEGETLRDRIEREGQLGVEEAVRIARDVADALDYAHRNDIIHRDIKPANILLHDGRPVVADFGIALAISAAGGGRMTETGLSLGTPHYMSPEQASADRDLSARSDVYSLGCVLYEMLAGQPPHTGPSAQSILVRILTEDPRDVTELRRTVPPHVAATVMKSIEKLPADRFDTARQFMDALADPGFSYAATPRAAARQAPRRLPDTPAVGAAARVRVTLPWAVAVVALVLGAYGWLGRATEPTLDPPVRTVLDLGGLSMWSPSFNEILVSRDGSRFAFIEGTNPNLHIYVRSAEDMEFRPVPGVQGPIRSVAFSPDGDWMAYTAGDRLLRVSLRGGLPTEIIRDGAIEAFMLDWGAEGWIVFLGEGAEGEGLYRVPDTGGTVEALLVGTESRLVAPRALPDGSGVLFTDTDRGLGLYDVEADSARILLPDARDGLYAASGHILYGDGGGGLWAVPFDLDRREIVGDAKPVLQGVQSQFMYARFSVADNGTLVYTRGPAGGGGADLEMVVTGLDGSSTVLDLPPRRMFGPRWAPDGRQVVFGATAPGEPDSDLDIYLYDVELENAPRRLTNTGQNFDPFVSPDGRRVVFTSTREGTQAGDLFLRNLDDDAPPRMLLSLPEGQWVTDWPSDDVILLESADPSGLHMIRLVGDSAEVTPYYTPQARVFDLVVSPDGTLAAYTSDESGQREVYVRAFPQPRAETIVSEGGGGWPQWSPDGGTLYYRSLDGNVAMAAEVAREPTFRVVNRRVLFDEARGRYGHLHPDGDRFIATRTVGQPGGGAENATPLQHVVIHSFFTELHRLFRVGGR